MASKTLLRNLDNDKTQAFESEHADRIKKYPGSRWVDAKEADVTAERSEKAAPAKSEQSTATDAPAAEAPAKSTTRKNSAH